MGNTKKCFWLKAITHLDQKLIKVARQARASRTSIATQADTLPATSLPTAVVPMSSTHTSRTFLRRSARLLGSELRALSWHGPRALLAAQTVTSVLLAVAMANLFGLHDRWWVAISAYVVMRADWHLSLQRARLRMIGTLGGALLCLPIASRVVASPWAYALTLAAVMGSGVYLTLGSRHSYGWLLATITIALVLSDARIGGRVGDLAIIRVTDVAVGTLACVCAAGLAQLGRRRWGWPSLAEHPTQGPSAQLDYRHPAARQARAWQALPCALAVLVLGLADYRYGLADFAQMLVTIAVIPVIPLTTLLERDPGEAATGLRMANRIIGCLLAAAVAALLLPWIDGHALPFLLTLGAGIWLASHMHSGHDAVSYIGLQFGIALLMAFVQDQAWRTDLHPALMRLLGILIGVAALALTRLATAYLRRRLKA